MIIQESKLIDEEYVDGYYLTQNDLRKLLQDFVAANIFFDINDWIEQWLKNHNRIVKKD
jgi:hypothetical protein